MSDLLIEIAEELERRFGFGIDFWMDYIMEGYYIPKDLREGREELFGQR